MCYYDIWEIVESVKRFFDRTKAIIIRIQLS